MANIVTQLQNKDGDNLYPLAGGMAADSVTTQMIQDGAVTSDKVDWTTLPTDVLDVSKISVSSGFSLGASMAGAKYGKIVILSVNVGTPSLTSSLQEGIELPSGWHPTADNVNAAIIHTAGNIARVRVTSSGKVYFGAAISDLPIQNAGFTSGIIIYEAA
jgi:hypothetical protein